MKTMKRFVMAMVLALGACAGDDDGGDPGEDLYTNGQACNLVGSAVCARVGQCGLLPAQTSVGACTSMIVQLCCAGPPNECAEEIVGATNAQVDACAFALRDMSCADAGNPNFTPIECLGVAGKAVGL